MSVKVSKYKSLTHKKLEVFYTFVNRNYSEIINDEYEVQA
jgi:hypothetical protein